MPFFNFGAHFEDGFDLTVRLIRAGMDVPQRGRHVHETAFIN
jgi:hypothetical protein